MNLIVMIIISASFIVPVFAQSQKQVEKLDELMQIYLVKTNLRSKEEKVTVKTLRKGQVYAAKVSYWRSLKDRDSEIEICNAYRWLLFGRGKYGQGAAEAFAKYPKLKYIELEFFDVEYTTVLGKKRAEVLPSRKVIPYLKLAVKASNLMRNSSKLAKLEKKLYKGNCRASAKSFIEKAVFDEKYIQKAY